MPHTIAGARNLKSSGQIGDLGKVNAIILEAGGPPGGADGRNHLPLRDRTDLTLVRKISGGEHGNPPSILVRSLGGYSLWPKDLAHH